MKYFSIDCEMTGLNPENHQIIEFGAIFVDTVKNTRKSFTRIVIHPEYIGEAYAINMNNRIFDVLAGLEKDNDKKAYMEYWRINTPGQLVNAFYDFIGACGIEPNKDKSYTINVAGKNFASFDQKFLEKLPKWNKKIRISSRILDPGILYVDWNKDERLPSLGECKKRAGMNEVVSHNALMDAMDVVDLLEDYKV